MKEKKAHNKTCKRKNIWALLYAKKGCMLHVENLFCLGIHKWVFPYNCFLGVPVEDDTGNSCWIWRTPRGAVNWPMLFFLLIPEEQQHILSIYQRQQKLSNQLSFCFCCIACYDYGLCADIILSVWLLLNFVWPKMNMTIHPASFNLFFTLVSWACPAVLVSQHYSLYYHLRLQLFAKQICWQHILR